MYTHTVKGILRGKHSSIRVIGPKCILGHVATVLEGQGLA